jgi:hypothetical protein
MSHHSPQVEPIKILRLNLQNPRAQLVGLVEPARLLKGKRLLQKIMHTFTCAARAAATWERGKNDEGRPRPVAPRLHIKIAEARPQTAITWRALSSWMSTIGAARIRPSRQLLSIGLLLLLPRCSGTAADNVEVTAVKDEWQYAERPSSFRQVCTG